MLNPIRTMLLAMLLCGAFAFAADKPNIVFILADDLGVNDLGCYGRKDHNTPNLDKLATQGLRFTQAYCAQPICSPTRAALMTGKTPARLHLTTYLPGRANANSQLLLHPEINQQLPLEHKSIAELLKPAGYTTACIGKWHLGGKGFLPADQGFDFVFAGHANTKPSATEGGKGEYELTAQAEQFMEQNKDKPFFLYLAHNSPHIGLDAKPELIEKNKGAFNPMYAAVIETLDDVVGRVVAKVDALGLAERTLIIFTSDNGGLHVNEGTHTPATHNTPFRAGKGYCYEGGLRIPLITRWTGKIKTNALMDAPVISTDWVPTFMELAGAATDEKFDGVSLANLLLKNEPLAARPLLWHYPHYTNQGSRPAGAVRDGNFKLLEHYEDGRLELFDLAADPGETTDISAEQPAKAAELRGKLEAWRREINAQGNTANQNFEAGKWKFLYADNDTTRVKLDGNAEALNQKQTEWRKWMNAVIGQGPNIPAEPPPQRGAVILHARDAKVHGEKLYYEKPPHKDTLGYWVNANDWAEWTFDAPGAGTFEIEILQGCGTGSGGAEVEFAVGEQKVLTKIEETGHFQRFIPRTIGTVKFDKAGPQTLTVKVKAKPGHAVMDLRRVTIKAAP